MSHFKYEIDERNLRVQLKSNEVAFSEEAWQKFDSFASAQKNLMGHEAVRRFSLSVNRNVVLPVVFGSVIVLFSLLLFNFINIKNPNPAGDERAETKPQPEAGPAVNETKKEEVRLPETAVTTPVQEHKQPAAMPQAQTGNVINQATAAKAENTEPNTAGSETKAMVSAPVITEPVSLEARKPESTAVYNNVQSAIKIEPSRKKLKKREPVITEASAEDDEQAPPPSSPDISASAEPGGNLK